MTVIAVDNVPDSFNLRKVAAFIAKQIKGHLIPMCFDDKHFKKGYKLAYLQLSPQVDAAYAIDVISHMSFDNVKNLIAYVTDRVPECTYNDDDDDEHGVKGPPIKKTKFNPQAKNPNQTKPMPKVQAKKTKASKYKLWPPYTVLMFSHREIMLEMQRKYTGLPKLAALHGDLVLDALARTIYERLLKIMKGKSVPIDSFNLTWMYRNQHPHFADFQLILSKLHEVEDSKGLPRTELIESEFMATPKANSLAVKSHEKVLEACSKYAEKVSKKIVDHIESLDTESSEMDSEMDSARKKVRAEMKKMTTYIPTILRLIVNKHVTPEPKSDIIKMSIYGEPFLPGIKQCQEFLSKHKIVPPVGRAKNAFNLLRCAVRPPQLPALLACDGFVIAGSKLVIRPSESVPRYSMPPALKKELFQAFKVPVAEQSEPKDDDEAAVIDLDY